MPVALQAPATPKRPTKRDQWVAERATYLGASEAAAVLGLNPHQSAHDVWLVKKGLGVVEETVPMRRGLAMEPFLSEEYKRLTGIKPKKSQLYRHKDFPFIAVNPDREVVVGGEWGLLELKDVGYWPGKQFGQDGADQIPEHYLIQIMVQLIVTGAKFVQLLACVDGRDLRLYTYTFEPGLYDKAHVFDKETGRKVFNTLVRWWQDYVIRDVEPPMTGHESDTAYLQQVRPTYENGQLTNTDEETDALCVQLEALIKAEKDAAFAVAEAKNKIKSFMAERQASTLESSVGFFSFNLNKNGVASFKTPFSSGRA